MKRFAFCFFSIVLILSMLVVAADITGENLDVSFDNGNIVVSGSFNAQGYSGQKYSVFLATYGSLGTVDKVEISPAYTMKDGANSFKSSFEMTSDEQNVRVFVLTEKFMPICEDISETVKYEYIDWNVSGQDFYDALFSGEITNDTALEKLYRSNDEVTVAEGIAMASYLHAIYHNVDVNSALGNEFRINFDGDEATKCNLSYFNSEGSVSEGVIVYKPTGTTSYDHGIKIEGMELDAKKFNKLTVRMKRDYLANASGGNRIEELEIFFKTNVENRYTGSKCVYHRVPSSVDMSDWQEYTIELSANANYKDLITGIRFDSTNNNGVYYIDYIMLSQSEQNNTQAWYDMFVDYATDNGLIDVHTFGVNSYNRSITKEELCALFVRAIPESHFNSKNSIKGIPDVNKDDWNADVFLMLYNAGITLGDANGNFNAKSPILRSEASMIANRIMVKGNRLSGSLSADWTKSASSYDQEFDKTYSLSFLCPYKVSNAKSSVNNGAITLTATTADPQIGLKSDKNLTAADYNKVLVRMKVDVDTDPENILWDFFFKTSENTSMSEMQSLHEKLSTYCYVDAAGWYIIEIDLDLQKYWRGTVKNFRFDPANQLGTYTIDYIRFIENEDKLTTHEELLSNGYTASQLLSDNGFENGFYVCQFEQKNYYNHGKFTYNEGTNEPLWQIDPWWSKYDLWENRDTSTDKYTLKDTNGINTLVYNPELKSLSMRLNATNIYNGEPHTSSYNYWPHLLIEQNTNICAVDKQKNAVGDGKLYAEIDVRMTDFKDTTNTEGTNSCLYLIYFYLRTDKAPGHKIWFGLTLFENDANKNCGADWNFDPYSDMMIYRMTTVSTYGDLSKSFTPSVGSFAPGNEWKTLRVDLMPEIRRAVEWANRDNIFGTQVSVEDMYIDGVNLGYETHGNFDCTFEIKNFNLISYTK